MLKHEKRFLSALIDIGIVLIISLIMKIILPNIELYTDLLLLIIYFVVSFLYHSICFITLKDKTIGMHIMSLKCVSNDYSRVSQKSLLIRTIAYSVPIFYSVNILYMLLYKTDETYFDKLSNSYVAKLGETYKIAGQ